MPVRALSPAAALPPTVAGLLRALRDCGYSVVVASSGEGSPPEADRAALAETGAALLCRPNSGLDFGAWQHLIAAGCADDADRVLLANDSVFGPFHPLTPILDRMDVTTFGA